MPIGRPIWNTQIFLLDEHRQPVPIGVKGEIYIGGAGLARGYLNRPELTSGAVRPESVRRGAGARLYRTGDIAEVPGRRLRSRSRAAPISRSKFAASGSSSAKSKRRCAAPVDRRAVVVTRPRATGRSAWSRTSAVAMFTRRAICAST